MGVNSDMSQQENVVTCDFCHLRIAAAERRKEIKFKAGQFTLTFHFHARFPNDCMGKQLEALRSRRANIAEKAHDAGIDSQPARKGVI